MEYSYTRWDEWSRSRPFRFRPREIVAGLRRIGGLVGSTADLDTAAGNRATILRTSSIYMRFIRLIMYNFYRVFCETFLTPMYV